MFITIRFYIIRLSCILYFQQQLTIIIKYNLGLYQQINSMQYVKQYVKQNKKQLQEIFASMSNQGLIQATKVYSFLQSAFDTQQFKLMKNNLSIFALQQNQQQMQSLIEKYYLSINQGQTKFYMYRVTFQFNQVIDIIKFWLSNDSNIQIYYKGAIQNNKSAQNTNSALQQNKNQSNQQKKSNIQKQNNESDEQKSDNEFMPDIKDIPQIIKAYQEQINKYELKIKTQPLNQQQIKLYKDKINQLQTKILFMQQRLKDKPPQSKQQSINQQSATNKNNKNLSNKHNKTQNDRKNSQNNQQNSSVSPRKSVLSMSPSKIDNTLKAIFQFYAKQLHVTGVKASFERIEHESNRINYQKLVHFLKQYKIFPSQSKDQKKLHHFYIKCSSNTRDLTYEGFLSLLQNLSQIIISSSQTTNNKGLQQKSKNRNKFEQLKIRIIQQRRKNKILNNPFHSLQKQDFRIDKSSLRYQFKLLPLNGKDPQQIINQLQSRKIIKQQKKNEKEQSEINKKIKYLKKLQSIDPFHPLVQKNKHLIKSKSILQQEPIVSMDNIEMYRDKSFDLKLLGIQSQDEANKQKKNQSPLKGNIISNYSYQIGSRANVNGNNSYLIRNRAKQIQKLQVQKMKNLMSGIIQRSNAKLQKLGISPNKKHSIH